MRFNPVIPLHVYRPRMKVVLHDPEGFFDFPLSFIHTNDFGASADRTNDIKRETIFGFVLSNAHDIAPNIEQR